MLRAGQLDEASFEAALDRLNLEHGRTFSRDTADSSGKGLPVLDAVRTTPHLLVLGDPGAGKTTLLRYLALSHARAFNTDQQVNGLPPMFPIYLRVGEFARRTHQATSLTDFMPTYLKSLECHTPGLADLIQRRLSDGGCLVLLDGLDEIASAEQRRSVVEAVVNFVTAHSRQDNRFVVTSRISGYSAAPLPAPFEAVRLQDMDDATIARFLEVYCQEVERAETPGGSASAIRAAAQRETSAIQEALSDNAGVRRLATNPLLLTALVLVHRASGRLPHRRVEAYVEVCQALGRTWRSVQGVAEADLPDDRVMSGWLTELGEWIHEHRPEGSATKLELLRVLGALWAANQGITWDDKVLQSADPMNSAAGLGVLDFVDKIDRHTGLLVERAPGRYGFTHLTFEEYYAGRALAFRGDSTERAAILRSRLHDPRYDEPILLALGLIGIDYFEQLETLVSDAIYPATHNPSPHEDLLGRDFLFMLRALADDIPLSTVTIDAIINRSVNEWLNPQTSRCRFSGYRAALSWHLSALGSTKAANRLLMAIESSAEIASRTTPEQFCTLAIIACELGRLTDPIIACLTNIANTASDPSSKISAVEALSVCGMLSEPVVDIAQSLITTLTDSAMQVKAVQALAAGDQLYEPALIALSTLAINSDQAFVRIIATQVLAARRALTNQVITAVTEQVTSSNDQFFKVINILMLALVDALSEPLAAIALQVSTTATDHLARSISTQALVRGGAISEATVATLTELATNNDDPTTRVRAVEVLSAGNAVNERAIHALTDLATSADELTVRNVALEALANPVTRNERTVAALTDLATNASDPTVRMLALEALVSSGPPTEHELAIARSIIITVNVRAVKVRALQIVAKHGTLTKSEISTALRIATGAGNPSTRIGALEVLANGGALSEPAIRVAIDLAQNSKAAETRRAAVRVLGQTTPTTQVRECLLSRFDDETEFVRLEAERSLVELGRQHPDSKNEIETDLVEACIASGIETSASSNDYPCWDYANRALRLLLEVDVARERAGSPSPRP